MSLAAELTLLRPWWLLALLPLGLLLWREWRRPDRAEAIWRQTIDAHLLSHLLVRADPRQRRIGLLLSGLGVLLAVLALAGPALERPSSSAYRRDAVRVLVVDLSAEMAAHLEQVKPKLLALLQQLPAGQTALIVYAGEPYLVAPPSVDAATLARFVPELAADIVPVPGNRHDLALRMAEEVLARSGAAVRDVVWVTAGGADALKAAAKLEHARLSILHAAPLAAGAGVARHGGVMVRMSADDGDVRQLLTTLDGGDGWIAASASAGQTRIDAGYWLLLPLLPLAALAFRQGVMVLLLAPLLLAAPQPAQAQSWFDDQRGWQLLEAGQPEAAAARFADLRWRAVASYRAGQYEQAAALLQGLRDADSLYNRGNALARMERYAEALAAYEAAIELRPDDADARHNRDLVQQLLNQREADGQGKPPPPDNAPRSGQGASDEAGRVAEQWLRNVPDQPESLLRRKLLAEQRRRDAGKGAQP